MKIIPQTDLSEGVLTVLDKRGLWAAGGSGRGDFSIVIYCTWWHLPSTTLGEIEKRMRLLHFSWEWHQFIASELIWAPWDTDCLLRVSWGPPESLQNPCLGSRAGVIHIKCDLGIFFHCNIIWNFVLRYWLDETDRSVASRVSNFRNNVIILMLDNSYWRWTINNDAYSREPAFQDCWPLSA